MKSSCAIILMCILLLAACGPASTPGQASGATQVAVTTDSVVVPQTTPTTPPKQAGPSAVARSAPPSTPAPLNAAGTTTPQLPPGWQTVEWEGLIIPVPPGFTWVPNRPEVRILNNVPVLATGVVAPNLPDEPVIERPSGPAFYILQWSGSLEAWLNREVQAVNAQPVVTPIAALDVRDTMIAGRPAKAYPPPLGALGPGYEVYALRLDDTRLLSILTEDTENDTYRRVIDGLVITAGAVQATPTPAHDGQLPSGWQQTTWETLAIPIPPRHTWQLDAPPPNPGYSAPVRAFGRIAFDRTQAPPDAVELPDGIAFTILQWSGSLDAWLAQAQKAATPQNPVDTTTISRTTVAGNTAVAYSYTVTGVSISRTYALKLATNRLLLIENSNVDNQEYQAVLDMLTIGNQ